MPFAPAPFSPVGRRLALACLDGRLRMAGAEPTWVEVALVSAWVALLTRPRSQRLAAAALTALGREASRLDAWRFAWRHWYALACDAVLARQADRLTPSWVEQHLPLRGSPPHGGILVMPHHACQFLGFVRLAGLLPRLGLVATFDPRARHETARAVQLSRLLRGAFGERVYPPARSARPCLELLDGGGSVLLLPDFFEDGPRVELLGRRIGVGRGAVWLAERTRRPIVPCVVSPTRRGWELWCGEPVGPSLPTLVGGLEQCIRHAPTAWLGWRDWLAAPAAPPERYRLAGLSIGTPTTEPYSVQEPS